jgi:hypothetical protein
MRIEQNREAALGKLLSEMFDGNSEGLRQWVRLHLGKEIDDELPPDTPLSQLSFRTTLAIQQHGLASKAFASLLYVRPNQAERIQAVARLWESKLDTQAAHEHTTEFSPPDGDTPAPAPPVTRGDVVGRDKIVFGDEVRGDKHVHNTYQVDSATDVGWLRHRYLRWGLGVGAGILLLTVLLNGDVSRALCVVPGVQSICGALGAGGVADDEERKAWCAALEALPSPDGLNDYLRRYRDGVYAREAESRLAHDCTTKARVHWLAASMEHPLLVSQGDAVFASREAAERDARERGAERARALLCGAYTEEMSSGVYRLDEVTAEPAAWKCTDQDGWKCGFDGRVICDVEKRQTETFIECAGSSAHGDCES